MNDEDRQFPSQADCALTTREAFGALVVFLEAFWVRDGRKDDGLRRLLSWTAPVGDDQEPADPAMWSDWLDAIAQFKEMSPPRD